MHFRPANAVAGRSVELAATQEKALCIHRGTTMSDYKYKKDHLFEFCIQIVFMFALCFYIHVFIIN